MKVLLLLLLGFCNFSLAYSAAEFDKLLKTYVSEEGWVDYDAWSASEDAKARLQGFLEAMARFDPSSLRGSEELAFWINAYNAFAIAEVLERYPVDSIRPTFLGIPDRSFFVATKHRVNGQAYSLDQIEHDILRKLDEVRIHFAINCASISCPKLRNEAYTTSRLDMQLTEQASLFINDQSRNQFDVTTARAQLSKIFDWFRKDFDTVGGVVTYLRQFAQGEALIVLQDSNLIIGYLDYDWSLNRP